MNAQLFGGILIGFSALIVVGVMFVFITVKERKRAFGHLICYIIDAMMALAGFILGFGLEIKSIFWIIFPMIIGRFAFHILNASYFIGKEKEEKKG